MSTVLKIALPGFDSKGATPEECAVHSDYPAPKIDSALKHFVNINLVFNSEPPGPTLGSSTLTTILYQAPHDYNYVPQLWLHVEYLLNQGTTSLTFGPGTAYLGSLTGGDSTFLQVYADTTNYYVAIIKNSGTLPTDVLSVAGTNPNIRLYIMSDGVLNK